MIEWNFEQLCYNCRSKADIGGCEVVRPEEALITLPISYDPVAMLDQLETQFNFSMKATHTRMQLAANSVNSLFSSCTVNVIHFFPCLKMTSDV